MFFSALLFCLRNDGGIFCVHVGGTQLPSEDRTFEFGKATYCFGNEQYCRKSEQSSPQNVRRSKPFRMSEQCLFKIPRRFRSRELKHPMPVASRRVEVIGCLGMELMFPSPRERNESVVGDSHCARVPVSHFQQRGGDSSVSQQAARPDAGIADVSA